MYELALMLCEGQVLLHSVAEGSGPKRIDISNAMSLLSMRRPALLRLALVAVSASNVQWPDWPTTEVASLFGGLALSYARDQDLTMVAAIVRVAGRLQERDAMLDESCYFLLDQQRSDGSFGFLTEEFAGANYAHTAQLARLRIAVDVISALSSYLER